MVYAFIIHTLLPGTCKVLFYKSYGQDGTSQAQDRSPGDVRSERRAQIERVAAQVHSEYQFRRAVANRSVQEELQALNQDDTIPDLEVGQYRLPEGDPLPTEKVAVWLGVGNTGFTLVCHRTENLVLAELVLKLLIRYLQEHIRVLHQPAEASLKADKVCLVLSRFLPDGRLVFMNNRLVQGLEKELEVMMKA